MKGEKTVIIRIDSYFVDCLMMGKARSVSQLRARMMDVLKEAQTSDFVSIFCARYNFDRLDDVEAVAVDYAMDLDLDCGVVYTPH